MAITSSQTWIKIIGKVSLFATGMVYPLIGLLTFAAALDLGEESERLWAWVWSATEFSNSPRRSISLLSGSM